MGLEIFFLNYGTWKSSRNEQENHQQQKNTSMTLAEQIFEILESQSNPTRTPWSPWSATPFSKTVAAICCCSANLPKWLAKTASRQLFSASRQLRFNHSSWRICLFGFLLRPNLIWQWQIKKVKVIFQANWDIFQVKTLEQSWLMIDGLGGCC